VNTSLIGVECRQLAPRKHASTALIGIERCTRSFSAAE
jgi:hypothetical protein